MTWMDPNLGTLGPGLLMYPWWDVWPQEAASLKKSIIKNSELIVHMYENCL